MIIALSDSVLFSYGRDVNQSVECARGKVRHRLREAAFLYLKFSLKCRSSVDGTVAQYKFSVLVFHKCTIVILVPKEHIRDTKMNEPQDSSRVEGFNFECSGCVDDIHCHKVQASPVKVVL